MRIVIPVMADSLDAKVSPHFGRAPYYLFVETDENNNVINMWFEENETLENHTHGAIPAKMIKENVDKILFLSMGQNAKAILEKTNIELKQVPYLTLREILEREGIKLQQ